MTRTESETFVLSADTSAFTAAMETASQSTRNFGDVFAKTISGAVLSGKGLEETLRSLAMRLSTLALNSAIEPIEKGIAGTINTFLSSLLPTQRFAKGGVVAGNGPVSAFARGGIVAGPTLFSHAGGSGLMGEAGPEAIMPLRRGPDGRLGVAASANAGPVSVVFNVQTRDADSFRRAEGQLTAMLARAVARGARNL